MTTLAQLRKAALSHPETAEHVDDSGAVAFVVRDVRFAAVSAAKVVELRLPASDAGEVLAEHPTAQRLTRGTTLIGVRVPMGDINGQQLNHWVRRAWLSRASKRLAARIAAGDSVTPGEVGDLPKAIGGPATRALASAGISTLAQIAELTDAELLALHGVGPKAVRILREALA
ncbi:helix-hairpin-helix domain-containing protein [Streptomyces sp. WZ-12]|uniref:helix-hairpin-helix domain-containing protein n=1 Tax=Streptomyces sp. WZ-12 TaxID=3030210 RepID=UPI0023816ACB|nr:helix-hairpin-helix domain-containing protein [Streptomyces sp. WZ-12]